MKRIIHARLKMNYLSPAYYSDTYTLIETPNTIENIFKYTVLLPRTDHLPCQWAMDVVLVFEHTHSTGTGGKSPATRLHDQSSYLQIAIPVLLQVNSLHLKDSLWLFLTNEDMLGG